MIQLLTRLWWLLLFVMGGVMLTAVISAAGSLLWQHGWIGYWAFLHSIQWTQTVFVMALPPLLWVRFYLHEPVRRTMRLVACDWREVAFAMILLISLMPALDTLAVWCHTWPWPTQMQTWADAQMVEQDNLLRHLLDFDGPLAWAEAILLFAVGTAIGEELLFRGALMCCFDPGNRRQVVTAIIIGLLFAAVHFDLYGLPVRWLLGSGFVWLVYRSGSLLPAVAAHALNNVVALVEFNTTQAGSTALDEPVFVYPAWMVVASVAVGGVLIWVSRSRVCAQ